jgi:hypothetical protein
MIRASPDQISHGREPVRRWLVPLALVVVLVSARVFALRDFGRAAATTGTGSTGDLAAAARHCRTRRAYPVLTAATSPMGLVPGRRVLPEHLALFGDDHAPPSGRP